MIREIVLIDAADQKLTVTLAGKVCDFRFRFNPTANRWSFDLAVAGVGRIAGRRIVVGSDLLAAFGLGIGGLYAGDVEMAGLEPDYDNIIRRRVRIVHRDAA